MKKALVFAIVVVATSSQQHLRSQTSDKNIGVATGRDRWQATSPDGSLSLEKLPYAPSEETHRSDEHRISWNGIGASQGKDNPVASDHYGGGKGEKDESKDDQADESDVDADPKDRSDWPVDDPEEMPNDGIDGEQDGGPKDYQEEMSKGGLDGVRYSRPVDDTEEMPKDGLEKQSVEQSGDEVNEIEEKKSSKLRQNEADAKTALAKAVAQLANATRQRQQHQIYLQRQQRQKSEEIAAAAKIATEAKIVAEAKIAAEAKTAAEAKIADEAKQEEIVAIASKVEQVTKETGKIHRGIEKIAAETAEIDRKKLDAASAEMVKAKEVKEMAEKKLSELRQKETNAKTALAKAEAQMMEATNSAEAESLVENTVQEVEAVKLQALEKEKTYQIMYAKVSKNPTTEEMADLIKVKEENEDGKKMIAEAEKKLRRVTESQNEVENHGIDFTQHVTTRRKEQIAHENDMVHNFQHEVQAAQDDIESKSIKLISDAKDAVAAAEEELAQASQTSSTSKSNMYDAKIAYDASKLISKTPTEVQLTETKKQALDNVGFEFGQSEIALRMAQIKLVKKNGELVDVERQLQKEKITEKALVLERIQQLKFMEASANTKAEKLQSIADLGLIENKKKTAEEKLEIAKSLVQNLEEEQPNFGEKFSELLRRAQATENLLSTELDNLDADTKQYGTKFTANALALNAQTTSAVEKEQLDLTSKEIHELGNQVKTETAHTLEEDSKQDAKEKDAEEAAKIIESKSQEEKEHENPSMLQSMKSYIGNWFSMLQVDQSLHTNPLY